MAETSVVCLLIIVIIQYFILFFIIFFQHLFACCIVKSVNSFPCQKIYIIIIIILNYTAIYRCARAGHAHLKIRALP